MELPDNYGLVLLVELLIPFQCFMFGFIFITPKRVKAFNKEYMQLNYGDVHANELGVPIDPVGYPDPGSGKYTEAMSLKQWYELACGQRVVANYLGQIHLPLVTVPIAGLYSDIAAIALGAFYMITRIWFGVAYARKGPRARNVPVALMYLALLALIVLSVLAIVEMEMDDS